MDIIPILKDYPVRPDNSINVTAMVLKELNWPAGTMCRVSVDRQNKRIIIEKADG